MSYFARIQTKKMQDRPESNADAHVNELNMYLMIPGPTGKKREVKHTSTTSILINQEIITTTFLCCDDDEDNDA